MSDDDVTTNDNPGPSSPPVDLSPLEARIDKIANSLASLTRDTQERQKREAQRSIEQYERQVNDAVKTAEGEVDAAERAIQEAYDNGDPGVIAKANRKLTEAVAAREGARMEKREFDRAKAEAERREGGSSGAPTREGGTREADTGGQKDTTNLTHWKNRNSSWYGVDADMTRAAHEIDQEIRKAGVIPVGSKDYFRQIDRKMAERYPDKLKSAPDNAGGGSSARGGDGGSSGGRIPRDVIDGWKRMGIDVNDDKVLERMVKNREALARKGILPETPAYGSVIAR